MALTKRISMLVMLPVAIVMGAVFLAFAVDWKSPTECSAEHPCQLEVESSDVTQAVTVPQGHIACFEFWMWDHMLELELMISDAGAPYSSFPCTREQVVVGQCSARYDRFYFKLPYKTNLPNYWFVKSGTGQC